MTTTARPKLRPIEVVGVDKLHRVSPMLYRAAQPTAEGFKNLRGVEQSWTVLNLRLLHEDPDLPWIDRVWLRSEAGLMSRARLAEALQVIRESALPVLVHCKHGADRTGAVIAAYRISVDGWTPMEAIEEMMYGGYGFHAMFYPNLIRLVQDWGYNA